MAPTSDLAELTRREFVRVGAGTFALISCQRVLSAIPQPDRDFEHGNPLQEFSKRSDNCFLQVQ